MSHQLNHGDKKVQRKNNFFVFIASPWLGRLFLWLLPLSFLAIAFFFPLSRIIALTFDFKSLTLENLSIANRALRFTFYQASLSTLLTLLLGLPSAYLFARYNFPGKSFLRTLTAVPFMLPTVVVAASFNALLGQRGLLSNVIPLPNF